MNDLTSRAIEALVGPLVKSTPTVADGGPDPRDDGAAMDAFAAAAEHIMRPPNSR